MTDQNPPGSPPEACLSVASLGPPFPVGQKSCYLACSQLAIGHFIKMQSPPALVSTPPCLSSHGGCPTPVPAFLCASLHTWAIFFISLLGVHTGRSGQHEREAVC
jgi:hypothetical protein